MSSYLVEVYLPPSAAARAPASREEVSRAADEVTRDGLPIQLTQMIVVPEDETCFYFFDAISEQAVHQALARAELTGSRVGHTNSTSTITNARVASVYVQPAEESS